MVAVWVNEKVKNGGGIKEENVGEDCRNGFVKKQGGKIRRSRLAEVKKGNVCICIKKKNGEE